MKTSYIFVLLLLIVACTLSGKQEKSLNDAMSSYLDARNNASLKTYIDCIHPNALAYYKSQGDSIFMNNFNLNREENSVFLYDGHLLATVMDGKDIHAKYHYEGVLETEYEIKGTDVFIYALSPNDGKSWYFLDYEDYFNDQIIKPENRLIKK